jgi:microcystin degradation protein MlrC
VKALIRDMLMTQLTGNPVSVGDSALLVVAGVEVVLVSNRSQALNIDVFTQLGVALTSKKVVVVKSAQHFHASFSTIADHVIYVGAPGTATPKWHELTYRKARMPKWPIA